MIKLTNRLALVAIALLVYWVFIFVAITVFNFKIFQENLTQVFSLSILGIMALLGGAIVVNVMFNLTKISDALSMGVLGAGSASETTLIGQRPRRFKRKSIVAFLLSFPIIFGLLALGDASSAQKKKAFLVEAAQLLVEENQATITELADYRFSKDYLLRTGETLKVLSRVDENFPDISVILSDQIGSKPVFLSFGQYQDTPTTEPRKSDFIYSAGQPERVYLKAVFDQQQQDYRFSAHDGFYELYYPVTTDAKTLVLYFSDQQRYGKYGS